MAECTKKKGKWELGGKSNGWDSWKEKFSSLKVWGLDMRSTVSYTEDGMGGYTGFVLSRGLFLYKGTFLLCLGRGDGVLDD